jgi:hypothetical protein
MPALSGEYRSIRHQASGMGSGDRTTSPRHEQFCYTMVDVCFAWVAGAEVFSRECKSPPPYGGLVDG